MALLFKRGTMSSQNITTCNMLVACAVKSSVSGSYFQVGGGRGGRGWSLVSSGPSPVLGRVASCMSHSSQLLFLLPIRQMSSLVGPPWLLPAESLHGQQWLGSAQGTCGLSVPQPHGTKLQVAHLYKCFISFHQICLSTWGYGRAKSGKP